MGCGAHARRRQAARDRPRRDDFRRAASLGEREFERVFALGGGAPAVVGRDVAGHLIVPAITLHHLVPGIRAVTPDGRQRLIDYLVENFDELVYV